MNIDVNKELFKMDTFYVPKLMPEFGVIVEDRFLFFTSRNANVLVKFDINARSVVNVYYVPIGEMRASFLFSGMYRYMDKIYLIPNCANKIYVFDIKEEHFRVVNENILSNYSESGKLGEAIQKDSVLWIVSRQKKHILRLDMDGESIKEIGVDVKSSSYKLGKPFYINGYIYITSGDESAGIKIDIDTEKVLSWENGAGLGNAFVCDEFVYYFCDKEGCLTLKKRHLFKGDTEDIYSDEMHKVGYCDNRWLYEKIEDKIIAISKLSEYIIEYDINKGQIQKISSFKKEDGYAYGQQKRKHISTTIIKWSEGLLVLMSGRYDIARYNNMLMCNEVWSFDIDEDIVAKNECRRRYLYERRGQELHCYDKIYNLFEGVCTEEYQVGISINKYILECIENV